MIQIASTVLLVALLALATTGAGLAVAALRGLLQPRPADAFAGHLRAGECGTLRRLAAWWMIGAAAWVIASLAVQVAAV